MKYETLDSGQRQNYQSGMMRDSQTGKPNFYLILPKIIPYAEQCLTRIAELMTRGANKYSVRNWELANSSVELERFKSSAHRHFMQWLLGEVDEDHFAATFFNMQCAEYVEWRIKNSKCDNTELIKQRALFMPPVPNELQ